MLVAPPVGVIESSVHGLRNLDRVIKLDAKVSDGAFELGVTKHQLEEAQVLDAPVNQGRLGSRIECIP